MSVPGTAKREASGIAWTVLKKGSGADHPGSVDTVRVHYSGWTAEGKLFDSSVGRGFPSEFLLRGTIVGLQEALGLMVVGEKRRVWVPSGLAYGASSVDPRMPAGDLIYDVELLAINKGLSRPETPSDLAGAPGNSIRMPSGLAYRVIKPGTGTIRPGRGSVVKMRYVVWTSDGAVFDSSPSNGATPVARPVVALMEGLSEALTQMVVGEKARFWIPGSLAHRNATSDAGGPPENLVVDVELVSILD